MGRIAALAAGTMLLASAVTCTPYDAGASNDAGEAPSEADVGDAALPVGAGVASGSDAGVCNPLRAFVPFSSGAGSGLACNVDGVLPGATAPAGLDYVDIANWGSLDGMKISACVAVEMPRASATRMPRRDPRESRARTSTQSRANDSDAEPRSRMNEPFVAHGAARRDDGNSAPSSSVRVCDSARLR